MGGALGRLRWQLTLSHLVATAFTLVLMIAAAALFATFVMGMSDGPRRESAQDAQAVARAVEGLAAGDQALLNSTLAAIADGRLRLFPAVWPSGVGPSGMGPGRRPDWMGPAPHDFAYLVVLGRDGQVVASSRVEGAAFAPPEREEWAALAAQARRGTRDLEDLVALRPGRQPAVLAAAPIGGATGGQQSSVVVLARTSLPPAGGAFSFWRPLVFFGAATVGVLAAASIFALVAASVLAYFLAQRLVARLERLGEAAEALAGGDLARRVVEGPADEIGQLARRFNDMASDLEHSLSELESERDRVAGLLDAQRQLVANVSHELRTPVATLRGYVETALGREQTASSPLRRELETMDREIARLHGLIEDLFTLSRAEVSGLALRPVPTDSAAIVRRVVETAAPLAWTQRRVQVLAETSDDLPPAFVDPERLEQIVSNLLGNGVRHTPPGGMVIAVVTSPDAKIQLEVRDTGEGISPEDLPHIFERFYRGGNGDGRGGAGLGLALTKELAEAMGGSVTVKSQPGEGSSFTVLLPRWDGVA